MKKILDYIKQHYIAVTFIAFGIWITFFDSNSLISQYRLYSELQALKREKVFYIEEIKKNKTLINQIQTDPVFLEQLARERYLMKRDNEDIFIFIETAK